MDCEGFHVLTNEEEIYLYEGGIEECINIDLDYDNAAKELSEDDRIFWAAEAEKANRES